MIYIDLGIFVFIRIKTIVTTKDVNVIPVNIFTRSFAVA